MINRMNCEYKDCKYCIKEIDKEDVCEITNDIINYDFSDNNENCIGFEYQEKCENCKNGYCKDYSDEMEIDIDWHCKLTNKKIYEQMTFDRHNGEEIRECPYKKFKILDSIK